MLRYELPAKQCVFDVIENPPTLCSRATCCATTCSKSVFRTLQPDDFFLLICHSMQPRDVLRYDLLKIPMVRRFLRSKLWPEDINFGCANENHSSGGWVAREASVASRSKLWPEDINFGCALVALPDLMRNIERACFVGCCIAWLWCDTLHHAYGPLVHPSIAGNSAPCRFTVYAFAFLVGLLFIGPQDR